MLQQLFQGDSAILSTQINTALASHLQQSGCKKGRNFPNYTVLGGAEICDYSNLLIRVELYDDNGMTETKKRPVLAQASSTAHVVVNREVICCNLSEIRTPHIASSLITEHEYRLYTGQNPTCSNKPCV